MNLRAHFRMVGMRNTPPTYHTKRKKMRRTTLIINSLPIQCGAHSQSGKDYHHEDGGQVLDHQHADDATCPPLPFYLQVVEGLGDNRCRRHRKHCSKEDAVHLRPSITLPSRKPMIHMETNSVRAVMPTVPACFFNFLKLNSRPMANSRNTMPISFQVSTLWWSLMTGNQGK